MAQLSDFVITLPNLLPGLFIFAVGLLVLVVVVLYMQDVSQTRDLRPVRTVSFVNCPFPTLESDAAAEPARAQAG